MTSNKQSDDQSPNYSAEIARAILAVVSAAPQAAPLADSWLREIVARLPLSGMLIVSQVGLDWTLFASSGPLTDLGLRALPVDVIADSLDRSEAVSSGKLIVMAIPGDFEQAMAVVLCVADQDRVAGLVKAARSIVAVFAQGLIAVRRLSSLTRRCEQFEQMLRIGAQWSKSEDINQLLEAIAEAAARLLGAERASIFLWDRPRHKLVGRPALGVEGNQLEVDDSAGVVGAVLQSGQPRHWHSGDDLETEVNRAVDRKLKFQTRSLLAVPMWNIETKEAATQRAKKQTNRPVVEPAELPKQTLIGVFEVINKLQGHFTKEDEHALVQLAMQAAAAIQNTQLRQSLIANRDQLVESAAQSAQIIGQHSSINTVRLTAQKVAATELSVLILGENGTGKEVLARSIHFGSSRRHRPFIAVNCAALVESLLESELFGHEKGAFTDAQATRQGKFEIADGGTLFLDEVGDLSAGGQAKLLRVLEERKVVRVGGSIPISVDVRVIAATNQPLLEMVRDKKFREDLLFRLNTITLTLPPLRQRGGDVLLLAEHFLDQFSQQIGRKCPRFSDAAKEALLCHPWPGNIRELRNLVERVCYLCSSEQIEVDDLALSTALLGGNDSGSPKRSKRWSVLSLTEATKEFQVEQIETAIEDCQGNMTDAASRLGLHRSNLYRKMRQLGMETDDEKFQ